MVVFKIPSFKRCRRTRPNGGHADRIAAKMRVTSNSEPGLRSEAEAARLRLLQCVGGSEKRAREPLYFVHKNHITRTHTTDCLRCGRRDPGTLDRGSASWCDSGVRGRAVNRHLKRLKGHTGKKVVEVMTPTRLNTRHGPERAHG